jgi:predicted NAD/FAD-binding protein
LTQYALKHRHRPTLSPSFCLAALSLALLPFAAQASAQLQCTFDVNSETHHTVHGVATDPYTVAAVPIGNRFRFKAIVLAAAPDTASNAAPSAPTAIESVNLYVYYNTRRQPMVMQHVQYLQPLPQRSPAPDALTGRVALYSPLLGKELQYHCALAEVAP